VRRDIVEREREGQL
jgi:hypothetical protein